MATDVGILACTVGGMAASGSRTASAFTRKVVQVIRAYGELREIKTSKQLAEATGIKKWKIDRIVTYSAPVTLDELEQFAHALNVPAGQILDDAVKEYGGLEKLIADVRGAMSEGSSKIDDAGPATNSNDGEGFPETEDELVTVDASGYALAAETGTNEADEIAGGVDEGTAEDGSDDGRDGSSRSPRR